MKKDDILKILGNVKGEVEQDYKAKIIGIFGSYARGDERAESDVDILVDFAEDASLFDLVGLSLFLEEKLNCKVDIVPRGSLREEIKSYVLQEAAYL
jgi:predicted nucleotidyltransferase